MKLKSGIIGLIALAVLASCSTSNDVVSGRGIQKRKYTDGYYISLGKKYNKTNKELKDEDAVLSEETAEKSTVDETTATPSNEAVNAPVQMAESNGGAVIVEANENEDLAPVVTPEKTETNSVSKSNEVVIDSEDQSYTPGRVYPMKKIQTVIAEKAPGASGAMLILLVILCFIIPPLAVFLFEGASSRFWIDLVLFIIGIAVVGWLLNGISGLALLVSIIYALLIVLSVI